MFTPKDAWLMKEIIKRKSEVIPAPHNADSDISATNGTHYLL
jgi:hypothetical protein